MIRPITVTNEVSKMEEPSDANVELTLSNLKLNKKESLNQEK